jgi:hypothetical protein
LGTQSDHRKWNQHFILRGKSGFSSPKDAASDACQTGAPAWRARHER